MISKTLFLSVLLAQLLGTVGCEGQPDGVIGTWKLEVAFTNGRKCTLRFEALAQNKGSIELIVPKPLQIGSNAPSPAIWTQPPDGVITFSGPVQFPLGNVGIARGKLVLKGKLGSDGTLSGKAEFFPTDQEPENAAAAPSMSGTFAATRTESSE